MNLFSVEGKTVVVTGGSRGIGKMIATGFVQAGATVYISSRKAAEVEKTAAELGCVAVPADLSTPEGAERLFEAVSATETKVDVLVNNAGATWGAPLEEFPEHAFDKLWGINVKGVFFLTTRFLPLLRAAATADDPARVINIGSIDGLRVPGMETYAYSATKAAVHMLTRHLAQRLAGDSITVNAIAPGPFDSKMMAFALDDPETRKAVASSVPLGRVGRPDDMAGAAIFLASRAGAYLTGTVIPVDGGITAR
ncbi:NAD(P)-dependent dehydrogenase (short-subunit alcohol dehydrogenase family) [Thermocatellispora tengchongensis]|uniref:NAD(P)-dependent dehydrogenase (Short-subunit alcohol dehydrogenase family) n=1 Tax=Thermocatellispora tengchongensis TaxID=1073253 RepID=A0A840P5P9_9ACTN|nr:SDR family oxidoreductase [Thermocatellispora tengchongensis]MBB5133233.1 NAD(P)-dependent dehydrogenase (short-subunit alcohol dehydrogenase family) [Thermocatellispora tengchongensis]